MFKKAKAFYRERSSGIDAIVFTTLVTALPMSAFVALLIDVTFN